MAEALGYRMVALNCGGVLDVAMTNGHPDFVVEATLNYGGEQYEIKLDGATKLAIVKGEATRFVNRLEGDLARQASFRSGLPRHVPDDVKPEGALL